MAPAIKKCKTTPKRLQTASVTKSVTDNPVKMEVASSESGCEAIRKFNFIPFGMDNRCENDPSPVALLDMLAEVASATLEKNHVASPTKLSKAQSTLSQKAMPKRRRSRSQNTLLNLDQIRMLSDKLLLNMFSESMSDELRRTHKFTCFLMPDKCQQSYSSFGNETRARMQMKTHLLSHVAELLAETNARTQRSKFVAEPLQARNKRLAAEQQDGLKRKPGRGSPKSSQGKVPSLQLKAAPAKDSSPEPSGKVRIKNSKKLVASSVHEFSNKRACTRSQTQLSSKPKVKLELQKENNENKKANGDSPSKRSRLLQVRVKKEKLVSKVNEQSALRSSIDKHLAKSTDLLVRKITQKQENDTDHEEKICNASNTAILSDVRNTLAQPWHDHNYTHVDGKTMGADELMFGSLSDEEQESEVHYSVPYLPIVTEEICSDSMFVSLTNSVSYYFTPSGPNVWETIEIQSETSTPCPTKHARQQKKKRARRINKLVLPEEHQSEMSEVSDDDHWDSEATEEALSDSSPVQKDRIPFSLARRGVEVGSPEWERKLALKCIRMLRAKKKAEFIPLRCKICKNKTFTAQATLMYHYRSHAGIKPFVCTICNTTFTRQHSLNYHMLIHNNKSRFTCVECGRKFRHPSHFKEHMRRHTGETPFECSDCGLRFKTRNTYKRHLKTRHGKLLTANGIRHLSSEDFMKVKTNPRRKSSRWKDKETQWPEYNADSPSLVTSSMQVVMMK